MLQVLTRTRHQRFTVAAERLFNRARNEPMVWFALLGAGLFFLVAALDLRRDTEIRISAGDIAQISAYWEAQAQRAPSEEELAGLIEERVNEEALYREALRMGLDRDDVIVRRRLAQKVAFLRTDNETAPSEAALQAYYAENSERYAAPDTFTFEHIYFSPERHGAGVERAARAGLERIEEGGAVSGLGDPFMLQLSGVDVTAAELARDYGESFARALAGAPIGVWSGPVESAYGLHLVRVVSRQGAFAQPYETVAAQVREDYLADRRRSANTAWVRDLRSRYRIVIEDGREP